MTWYLTLTRDGKPALCDEGGNILPGQSCVSITAEPNGPLEATVTVLIDSWKSRASSPEPFIRNLRRMAAEHTAKDCVRDPDRLP